ILSDLNISVDRPVSVCYDSSYAIQIAGNPVFYERTKHFEIDLYFLRERVSAGLIKTVKIKFEENIADLFTKKLPIKDHQRSTGSFIAIAISVIETSLRMKSLFENQSLHCRNPWKELAAIARVQSKDAPTTYNPSTPLTAWHP
ncbi:hypothetical protein Tco_1477690, partial [Tanacetum coccineum]